MPAFKGKNFRSGDLAEQLGLLLLQNVALVAPVPRTEDVGIDAIVTLLEDFDAYRFKASNSFYVQIKSKSVTAIDYIDEQVTWLFALELPFFIAEVDRSTSRIELYCSHTLHEAFVLDANRKHLRLEFDNGIETHDFIPPGDVVNIGPPILSWSMDDLDQKPELRTEFNAVCKAHIEAARWSMEMRRLGMVSNLEWEENNMPRVGLFKSMILKHLDLGSASDLVVPYLVPFLDLCVKHGDEFWLKEIILLAQESRLLLFLKNEYQKHPPGTHILVPDEFKFLVERAEKEKVHVEEYLNSLSAGRD